MTQHYQIIEHEGIKYSISVGVSCYYIEPLLEEGQTFSKEQLASLIEEGLQNSKGRPENPEFSHVIEESGNGFLVKIKVEKTTQSNENI